MAAQAATLSAVSRGRRFTETSGALDGGHPAPDGSMTRKSDSERTWAALTGHLRRLELLQGVAATLGWDEQTMMPPAAARLRGAQQALLAGIAHAWLTDARVGDWLESLEGTVDPVRAACHRNLGRAFRRARPIPPVLVEELAAARSDGLAAWLAAKRAADFSLFAPKLERLIDLSRRRAEAIDPRRHPYEVALEDFEPGTTVDALRETFARLREGLVPLLEAIASRPQLPTLGRSFDARSQEGLHREVAEALGYDFAGGRLDHAEHPFSSAHGLGDVRITTHIEPDALLRSLGGTIHETGHALYEQGLPHELAGTTVARVPSFGLHESQSRFWENFIGRSEPFHRWLAGPLRRHFPDAEFDATTLHRAANRVERGPVRTRADEVTYDLHIIVRFELELALFEGRLAVEDLPSAWNRRYEEVLGIVPPDDAQGVLQDVHWAEAAFGYFPSYTLGNLYASSLGAALEAELPDLQERVERGDFAPVLAFLRERVHARGHIAEAPDIVRAAVGERDPVEDLLSHLWSRHGRLYGVVR